MTQMTEEPLEATCRRVAEKLQAFSDGLTDDERLVLNLAMSRLIDVEEADMQGHMINQDKIQPAEEGTGGGGKIVDPIFGLIGLLTPPTDPQAYPSFINWIIPR